ncbi:MAG TPA: alpha/beta hydrolase [Candidatus Babeliales bacterium]|nr:alpha/beta hydrolase [Candidatus Babeliales bacterium]
MTDTARNGNFELAYDVTGAGPDLLLVSGSASTRAIWSLVRPRLGASFRTIAFDNRDSGESTIAREEYGLSELAADALAVLDASGSQKAHVLGHSMGGVVAQELALEYPERVASLTLVATWARGDTYSKNIMELMASLTEAIDDPRALLAAILYAGAGTTTLRTASLFEMVDAAMALGPLAPREALLRQWQLDASVDTLARLVNLSMPVHVIWGTEDPLLPPWYSRQILDEVPAGFGTPIDACGHLPMIVAADDFVGAVTSFLSGVAGLS